MCKQMSSISFKNNATYIITPATYFQPSNRTTRPAQPTNSGNYMTGHVDQAPLPTSFANMHISRPPVQIIEQPFEGAQGMVAQFPR